MRALARRRLIRNVALLFVALGVFAAAALAFLLRGSLPILEGEVALPGLRAAVKVERDVDGIATVRGASRLDVARATGFLHGQERFFQMDLQRRRAAGELSELIGAATIDVDESARVHRFREVARRVVERFTPGEKALNDAYVEGVNAGVAALRARRYEYLLLRESATPWKTEDSVLCALSMFLTLHESRGERESTLAVLRDALPPAMFDFLAPRGNAIWDAPIDGGPIPEAAVPGPEIFDLRTREAGARVARTYPSPDRFGPEDNLPYIGSNNWAVDAARSASGHAMVADDMHLDITVPNIWYRLRLIFPDETGAERSVSGVSLPGTPGIVAGSNGRVAWGFTNTQADWNDLIVLEPGVRPDTYMTPAGPKAFERVSETVRVKGRAPRTLEILNTVWGPVIDRDHNGKLRAYQWTAHDPEAVNLKLLDLESADNVDQAVAIAHTAGAPPQNAVIADRSGRIAWTIAGRIPRRVGFEGRLPTTRSDASRRWDGYLTSGEVPKVVDPPAGRIWTANARVVSGSMLAVLGEGNYPLGARARQIRDGLFAKEKFSAGDLMDIQLDNRAVFLERWQALALATLDEGATAKDPLLREAKMFIANWGGRAAIDSVGYRLVKAFRLATLDRAMAPLIAPAIARDPKFRYSRIWQSEGPLWALVSTRPAHLLNPAFADWDALLDDALVAVVRELTKDGRRLAERTWGERNTARIAHPLSAAVPALSRFLDMKKEPLQGDDHMPRVLSPNNGASERFVVSPGKEEEGLFHMPVGQSSHPLSPYFGAGHEAWVRGEKTAFLPGPARYLLTLRP
jgi:penicillin amidase